MKESLKISAVGFVLFEFMLSGCAYNKINEVVPDSVTPVVYTYADVSSIFESQRCISCHKADASQDPLLEDFSTFKTYITDNRVKFETAIKYEGNKKMPQGGPKMPDTQITKILGWIEQGMKP